MQSQLHIHAFSNCGVALDYHAFGPHLYIAHLMYHKSCIWPVFLMLFILFTSNSSFICFLALQIVSHTVVTCEFPFRWAIKPYLRHSPSSVSFTSLFHLLSPLPPQVWLLHTGLQPAPQTQTCPRCRGWGWEDKFLHVFVLSGKGKWWEDVCVGVCASMYASGYSQLP